MASSKSAKQKKSVATKKSATSARAEEPLAMQTLRGMRDVLPGDQPYWQQARKVLERSAVEYGFSRVDMPVVELASLFERSLGRDSEIVQKQLYTLTTKGNERAVLRPELTSSVARAYIQHGMAILPQPVKLFAMGPVYRYDNPQEGRYREFYQAEYNIFGEQDPVLDAQVVQLAHRVLKNLGVRNIQFSELYRNSRDTQGIREAFEGIFSIQKTKLPAQQRDMIDKDPLRIFDAKDDKCMQVCAGAPQLIDHLDKDSRDHFRRFLEYLDELNVPYMIDSQLVRGLEYYTRTVFEISASDTPESMRRALGGGGRFDGLVESYGGTPTPAIGFAFGIDRVIGEMRRVKAKRYHVPQPRVFLAQLGELAKKKSLPLFAEIEQSGILVAESFGRGALKTQLRHASKLGVDLTLIIGQQEALYEKVIVKNMLTGTQETVAQKRIVSFIKKNLKESSKLVKTK